MNEMNSAVRPPRKKRSFLWLWILLLLASFTGGIVLGLNLNTLPLPQDVQNRLYPVLEALIPGSTAVRPAEDAPVVMPVPAVTPAPVPETPAPVVPAETPAYLPPVPMEEALQPEPTPDAEIAEPAVFVFDDAERLAGAESASAKTIGIDAARDAALKYAEVDRQDAEITGVFRTKDEYGQAVYEVSFKVGEISYEYLVSAEDGEILGWKASGFHTEDLETFGTEEPAPPAEAK